MGNILSEIVANKRREVEEAKKLLPPSAIYALVEPMLGTPVASTRDALLSSPSGIIAEFKRRSPSKGWIKPEGKAEEIPLSYQHNGASALSILADEKYFGGSDSFIRIARACGVTLPIVYKNFVIDEYQLFQARLCGASAVLLIAADLTLSECKSLMATAHELGLEVLLEMHAEEELLYAELEPNMYGINNRNLKTFVTDVRMSFELAGKLPEGVCKVSESGISSPATVRELRQAGFNGFLIGESFMKMPSPGEALAEFIAAL